MKKILDYLTRTYEPLALILYGSYQDGSNNADSDFDALVITPTGSVFHDTTEIGGVTLDVFVYPESTFEGDYDCEDFVQIWNGRVALDKDGSGARLLERVSAYVSSKTNKTNEEIADELAWCRKMLRRAARQDAEGAFRLHWLLIDSLEIFCDAVHRLYLGPKKTLRWMERQYPAEFALYTDALNVFGRETAEKWIDALEKARTAEQKTDVSSIDLR